MKDLQTFCTSWLAAWTGNEPERLIAFYTDDAFYRDPAKPNGLHGHGALLPYLKRLLAKNPNWVWKAVEIMPTEKGFTLKWEATIPVGDHVAQEMGLDIVELTDGKISRNEVYFDTARIRT